MDFDSSVEELFILSFLPPLSPFISFFKVIWIKFVRDNIFELEMKVQWRFVFQWENAKISH